MNIIIKSKLHDKDFIIDINDTIKIVKWKGFKKNRQKYYKRVIIRQQEDNKFKNIFQYIIK